MQTAFAFRAAGASRRVVVIVKNFMLFQTLPKTYSDFMQEITQSELYYGLLAQGLFAEKLPSIFTGEQFYNYSPSQSFADKWRKYIYYESIRDTNVPRQMGIPNPFAYQRLCFCIKENWGKLQRHFAVKTANQKHKISRIHLRKMKDNRRLFEMNYNNWHTDPSPETDMLIGKHFWLKQIFPTAFRASTLTLYRGH